MYSFFEFSSIASARISAAAGALIVSAIMMATAIVPASPSFGPAASFTMGALA